MRNSHSWRPPLAVLSLSAVVAVLYWATVGHLLGIGKAPDTATDAPLVILVVMVLIWNARSELLKQPIKPCFLGLAAIAALGFCWLSGQLVFTRVFTQFSVLAMIPFGVLTVFGVAWFRVLRFPFFILLFALSVWNPIVPTLVGWSANVAEVAIRISGVPIFRDGAYFVLPSGSWAIADACSGVAFFSTSLLLGILYAWTIYDRYSKRLVFICGAAAIGVAGNWVRVYLTMMIAHVSDNRLLRDDHYMFGWYLFAIFLFFYCWLGWRYRDSVPPIASPADNSETFSTDVPLSTRPAVIWGAGLAAIAMASVWPLLESTLSSDRQYAQRPLGSLPTTNGWLSVADGNPIWMPELSKPDMLRTQAFQKRGKTVYVFTGVYRAESWDVKLVTVANQLAGNSGSKFSIASRGKVDTELNGAPMQLRTGVVLGRGERILAWHWYVINGRHTASDLYAKFVQLASRLRGDRPASVWACIYTDAGGTSEDAVGLLNEFVRDMGPGLSSVLNAASS